MPAKPSGASYSIYTDCEAALMGIDRWVESHGLAKGVLGFDFAEPKTGVQHAVFYLAWPSWPQEELSKPVALLLSSDAETILLASQVGFKFFSEPNQFRRYVESHPHCIGSMDQGALVVARGQLRHALQTPGANEFGRVPTLGGHSDKTKSS